MTRIVEGFDPTAWAPLRTSSPLQSGAWLGMMHTRLPGTVHTVTRGDQLGFLGTVVDRPEAYEAYNPYAILWRDPPVFELAEPDERAQALARLAPDPGELLPAFVLVVPGYYGNPAGSAADHPEAVRACLGDVLEWCRGKGIAGLYVLYTDDLATGTGRAVAELGGARFPLTTRWSLDVRWDDWEGYLATLPGARRRKIRRSCASPPPRA